MHVAREIYLKSVHLEMMDIVCRVVKDFLPFDICLISVWLQLAAS